MVIPLSLGWLRGLLYLVGSLTWGALACVWVGWCLGWVVSGAQSFFGGVIFGGFLVLGGGVSRCLSCFLGVPGGGGVFSLQYGVLWVACLLVGVSCGSVVSLVILLWGGV